MSVTATFRVSAIIPVPEDVFAQAEAMQKLKPDLAAFEKAVKAAKGTFECKIIRARNETTPRKPKASKAPVAPAPAPAPEPAPLPEAAE